MCLCICVSLYVLQWTGKEGQLLFQPHFLKAFRFELQDKWRDRLLNSPSAFLLECVCVNVCVYRCNTGGGPKGNLPWLYLKKIIAALHLLLKHMTVEMIAKSKCSWLREIPWRIYEAIFVWEGSFPLYITHHSSFGGMWQSRELSCVRMMCTVPLEMF